VIAVDTNLLVYAHREDSPWHRAANALLTRLAKDAEPWAIPWPCVHEFLVIVTHPRIYNPPTPMIQALDQVTAWLESPSVVFLAESAGYWPQLCEIRVRSHVAGPRVHDARIAALCQFHGVRELWTADRDFGRFPDVPVRNPLVSGSHCYPLPFPAAHPARSPPPPGRPVPPWGARRSGRSAPPLRWLPPWPRTGG
jgi:toxin-antitoxin system PIN domain toxin